MKKKILIFGATGYVGRYMVQVSVGMGHQTYAYTRPINLAAVTNQHKLKTIQDFKAMGVTIVEGELDDHLRLVGILQQVDIVISTLPVPQYLDQLKIISAIKEANIERFLPSEFGCEADRATALPPFQAIIENKKTIRRATEAAGIPYTYVSANVLARYFMHYILFPDQHCNHQVTIYGSGQKKVVWNYEEDVAVYTIRAATDSRTLNKTIICRPLRNIASQLDVVSSWEKKTGLTLNRIHMLEDDLINLTQRLPLEESIPMAILHYIFIKEDQTSVTLKEDDLEASTLYSDNQYTSINDLIDSNLINFKNIKLSAFI
ncbi:unnamed protein product [Amaranthus hypochondriacus]